MDKVDQAIAEFRQANDSQLQVPASEAAKQLQVDRFDMADRIRSRGQKSHKKDELD